MQHLFRFGVLFCLAIAIFACNSGPTNEQLHQEVMDIHDAVMPKIHEIQQLSKQLEEKSKEPNLSAPDAGRIKHTLTQLEAADKAMWDWMNAFKKPDDSLPADKVKELLLAEKEKISKVSEMMLSSIEAAKEWTK